MRARPRSQPQGKPRSGATSGASRRAPASRRFSERPTPRCHRVTPCPHPRPNDPPHDTWKFCSLPRCTYGQMMHSLWADSVLMRAHEDMPERIAKQNCHRTCFQRSSMLVPLFWYEMCVGCCRLASAGSWGLGGRETVGLYGLAFYLKNPTPCMARLQRSLCAPTRSSSEKGLVQNQFQ